MGNCACDGRGRRRSSSTPSNIWSARALQYENKPQKSMSRCLAAQRICQILITYNKFKKDPKSCKFDSMYQYINDKLGAHYNNKALLNDYIHLINVYHTNELFEDVFNYLVKNMESPCNPTTCGNIERNNRDRANEYDSNVRMALYLSDDTKEVNVQQILDKVHCYWLHTFDFGYRLTKREREYDQTQDDQQEEEKKDTKSKKSKKSKSKSQPKSKSKKSNDNIEEKEEEKFDYDFKDKPIYITDPMDEEEKELLTKCVDDELDRRQRIIINKRRRLLEGADAVSPSSDGNEEEQAGRRMLRRNRSIQLMLDNKDNKFILNSQSGHTEKDKENKRIYSFGYPYKYGKHWKKDKWYIPEKYASFKEELIRKDLLQKTAWDEWLAKGKVHHDSDHCQQGIGSYLGDEIKVEHIVAIMLYCGVDWLQRQFTESYRKFKNESIEDLVNRHSEFAHWGGTLKDAVSHFGNDVNQKGKHKIFYHGIDCKMLFQSTIAHFYGPLSTSSEYEVSLVFANQKGDGLIVQLQNLNNNHARYFDCAWLSEYAYESEKFFIGGEQALIIKNIFAPKLSQNYNYYMEALNIIQQMFRGDMYRTAPPPKSNTEGLTKKEIKQAKHYEKFYPTSTLPIPKHIKKCVQLLIHHQLNKTLPDRYNKYPGEIPDYVDASLNFYCKNIDEIKVDWRSLHVANEKGEKKGYKFVAHEFITKNHNSQFLNLEIIMAIFPNVQKITVDNLNLSQDTMEAISGYTKFRQKREEEEELLNKQDSAGLESDRTGTGEEIKETEEIKEEVAVEEEEEVEVEVVVPKRDDSKEEEFADHLEIKQEEEEVVKEQIMRPMIESPKEVEEEEVDAKGLNLKEIIIYRPTKEAGWNDEEDDNNGDDDNVNSTDKNAIDQAIDKFQDDLGQFGWKMEKKARFELVISKDMIN